MPNFSHADQSVSETIIHRDVISRSEVCRCVEDIGQAVRSGKKKHLIKAKQELREIDILLIAYLVIFRLSNAELRFELWLNHANNEGTIYRKLQQYRMHASYSAMRDIFGISFWNGLDDSEVVPEGRRFSEEELAGDASTFAPTLVITGDTIDPLFFRPFKQDSLPGFVPPAFVNNNEELRKLYSGAWLAALESARPSDEGKTPALCLPAFWRSLEAAKILNFYLSRDRKEFFDKCTYGAFSHETFLNHYRALEPVFAELESKPPIFHFIYYLLVSSDLLPGQVTLATLPDFQRKVKNLWDFTKRLVTGLSELARNVTQHSSDKKGIITLRLYNREQFAGLFDVKKKDPLDKLSAIKAASAVFDINVIDLGVRGVIPTLADSVAQSVKDETNEILRTSFVADHERLGRNMIELSQLLDPKGGIHLDHQAKRAVAHLGLLIFSKIIEANHGLIRASSWSGPQTRDNFPAGGSDSDTMARAGTNFNVLLPIDADTEYGTKLPGALPSPGEPTRVEMLSLDDFFLLPTLTVTERTDEGLGPDNLGRSLAAYRLRPRGLKDRATELAMWNDFYVFCRSIFRKAKFRALDFDRIKGLSASGLFRFLGRWELEFSGKSLIIFNVPNAVFLELVEINEGYTSRLNIGATADDIKIPFWNIDTIQLIYSYVPIDDDLRFHLADALWGADKEQFLAVNRMIWNTNFNSVTLIEDDPAKPKPDPALNIAGLLRRSDLFCDGIALLPFDLMLKSSDGTSLFEQNARSLLMNELRVD